MKLSDLPPIPPKILIWGFAGTGKTCLFSTLGENAELLNCDANLRSAAQLDDKFKPQRHGMEVFNAISDQPQHTFTKLKNRVYDIASEVNNKTYKRKIVGLDSLTALGDCAMKMVQANAGKLSDRTKLPQPTMPEWGLGISEVENILNLLMGLPIPVVIIAHQLRVELDESVKMIPWALGNKLPDKLPRFFTEIWYSKLARTASGEKYMLQPNSTSSILARSTMLRGDVDQNEGMVSILGKIGWKV